MPELVPAKVCMISFEALINSLTPDSEILTKGLLKQNFHSSQSDISLNHGCPNNTACEIFWPADITPPVARMGRIMAAKCPGDSSGIGALVAPQEQTWHQGMFPH